MKERGYMVMCQNGQHCVVVQREVRKGKNESQAMNHIPCVRLSTPRKWKCSECEERWGRP